MGFPLINQRCQILVNFIEAQSWICVRQLKNSVEGVFLGKQTWQRNVLTRFKEGFLASLDFEWNHLWSPFFLFTSQLGIYFWRQSWFSCWQRSRNELEKKRKRGDYLVKSAPLGEWLGLMIIAWCIWYLSYYLYLTNKLVGWNSKRQMIKTGSSDIGFLLIQGPNLFYWR